MYKYDIKALIMGKVERKLQAARWIDSITVATGALFGRLEKKGYG